MNRNLTSGHGTCRTPSEAVFVKLSRRAKVDISFTESAIIGNHFVQVVMDGSGVCTMECLDDQASLVVPPPNTVLETVSAWANKPLHSTLNLQDWVIKTLIED